MEAWTGFGTSGSDESNKERLHGNFERPWNPDRAFDWARPRSVGALGKNSRAYGSQNDAKMASKWEPKVVEDKQ